MLEDDPEFGSRAAEIHGLTRDYLEKNGITEEEAVEQIQAVFERDAKPFTFVADGPDLNMDPSSQGLPRHPTATPFTTVYNNRRVFLPGVEPCGLYKNNIPYHQADGSGSWRGLL